MIIGQSGRLTYEAILFAASLRHSDPNFSGKLCIMEPQPNDKWRNDPRITDSDARTLLVEELGATIIPFENKHFGQSYPYGNKIEALGEMPKDEPFLFFDTDTLITGALSGIDIDFGNPSASDRVTATWPEPQLYNGTYQEIWSALYHRFDLDFESSLKHDEPVEYWRRHLYFNAGWFYYKCPRVFGEKFVEYAAAISNDPGPALAAQSLDPWLDQVALPLVIHALGGGRDRVEKGLLDGTISCHYRTLPLLFARESDHAVEVAKSCVQPNKIKKVLKKYEPMQRFLLQNRGQKVRDMFDRQNLPPREKMIRNQIKRAGMWMR